MLNPNNIIPLYYQLKEIMKEKIIDGSWSEGRKVPSERELMEVYDVSRATVRKALDELMTEGLIYRKQGVGTFVAKSKIEQNLIMELSFNKQALRKGLTPSSKVIHAESETKVSNRISDIFQLTTSEEIYKIIRVRLVNDLPFVLETLHIPVKFAPQIMEQDLKSIAVFQYLEKDCNLNFTHSNLDIEPVMINEFEAQLLETNVGSLALSLERIIYTKDQAVVIQKRIMRGDRGKFSFTLSENLHEKNNSFVGLEFNEKLQGAE